MTACRRFFLFLVCVLVSPVSQAIEFGGIKGRVDFCGNGGLDGMVVYIPGKQFSVITDASGLFEFELLPTGKYDINYRYNGKQLNYNRDILVNENALTDLSVVTMCDSPILTSGNGAKATRTQPAKPQTNEKNGAVKNSDDKDNDGFLVGRDCNDNDASIRPGAIELCDGKDNNCNGKIDESDSYPLYNGSGVCQAGALKVESCNSGFENCDGEPKNGCETNLNSDSGNCGACGNACSEAEFCAQGLC